jgi:thioredoxin-related protein
VNRNLGIAALIVFVAASACADEMPWAKDFETARARAAKSNQLILIDFYVETCGWCKKLDATTWQDAKVTKMAERFVPVKVNLETDVAGLSKKYNVKSHPFLLFVDSKGEVWGKTGYVPPSEFLVAASPVLGLFSRMPSIQAALERNPNDGPANCTMAQLEAVRGHREKAEAYLKSALDAGFIGPELAKAINAIGDCYQALLDYDGAIAWFLKGRTASKSPADESYSLISIVSCYLNKKDQSNAKKYAQILIELKDATREYVQIAKQVVGTGLALTNCANRSKNG